ncbi:MAG: hypothetical protein ABI978_05435 [Chloroflexota bacterium]
MTPRMLLDVIAITAPAPFPGFGTRCPPSLRRLRRAEDLASPRLMKIAFEVQPRSTRERSR